MTQTSSRHDPLARARREGPSTPGSGALDGELLQAVIDSAEEFAIVAVDPHGVVTSWSAGAERLFGYRRHEILGCSSDMLFIDSDRQAGLPEAERRKAFAEGRAEIERWHARKDGTRFWGEGVLTPLRSASAGFAAVLRDRSHRHATERELRRSEMRFRPLATEIPQLAFASGAGGKRIWGGPQWAAFTGLSSRDSRGLGWLEAVHPDDREATLAAWRDASHQGEYCIEHRIRRSADGEYRWHQTRARPVAGRPGRWVGGSTDVHDMRMLQDRMRILLAEMQHRTRNLLALVQSMTRQTLRMSGSLGAFGSRFESRLRSLSRVQALLARSDGATIDLHALLQAELDAHLEGTTREVRIAGPTVMLSANAAQTLALALHELATNAAKYGALQQPDGRLAVDWQVEAEDGQRRVALLWLESGVAMPQALPARKGYGSELIERALPYQLKAKTSLEFTRDGVRCSIRVPLDAEGGGS